MERITSPANPRIKQVARLQRQASCRKSEGKFCLEQARLLSMALDAGLDVLEMYVVPGRLTEADEALVRRCSVEPIEVTDDLLAKMAYRRHPGGWVAVLAARPCSLDDVVLAGVGPTMVCAGLEKPGNLGAILRSADAAGAEAVFIDDPKADLFNPNLVRASAGGLFTTPVVAAEAGAICDKLRSAGVRLVGVSPDGAEPYTATDLKPPVALVVGAEDHGLSDFWRGAVASMVCVPMAGAVDSLNVSVTSALMLFETQRR